MYYMWAATDRGNDRGNEGSSPKLFWQETIESKYFQNTSVVEKLETLSDKRPRNEDNSLRDKDHFSEILSQKTREIISQTRDE